MGEKSQFIIYNIIIIDLMGLAKFYEINRIFGKIERSKFSSKPN
jgi:hypothetical protein